MNRRSPLHRVFPVIHLLNLDQALRNADVAACACADGVFVIDMTGRDQHCDDIAVEIKRRFPELKVGINRLSMGPLASFERSLMLGLDMTWADRSGVTSLGPSAEAAMIGRHARLAEHEFFGSVAFKYQAEEIDPGRAARWARDLSMIATTSGPATGQVAPLDKIEAMRESIGPSARLAIASGITPANVVDYLPFASDFLVATGISLDEHFLDPQLTRELVCAVQLQPLSSVQPAPVLTS